MLPITEDVGFEEYTNSAFYNVYDKTGNWIYKLVSSKKADGQNASGLYQKNAERLLKRRQENKDHAPRRYKSPLRRMAKGASFT